jgi:hypothetical protein
MVSFRLPQRLAAAAALMIGLAMATIPHLAWWPRIGAPVYLADYDELVPYLGMASRAYSNHPTYLSDVFRSEANSSIYPRLQMVPGILIAKALRTGPLLISLVWRTGAGLMIGLGYFLIARQRLGHQWAAVAVASVLMADIGIASGWLLVKHVLYLPKIVMTPAGEGLFAYAPVLFPTWRIVTPALGLGYLLLYLWLLGRALDEPTPARLAFAGACFGLLFYVHIYYWTTAGLALVLGLALDRHRRRAYLVIGLLGGLVGLPSVVSSAMLKQRAPQDWLVRGDFLAPVPRYHDLWLHAPDLLLLGLGLAWVWARNWRLVHLWAVGAAAFLLRNHQVLTGKTMQNFHWEYVFGIACSLLLALLAAGELQQLASRRRWVVPVLVALCVMHLSSGATLRALEARRNGVTRDVMGQYERYRAQREESAAPRLAPRSVIAGDAGFVDCAVILENVRPLHHGSVLVTPWIRDGEWHERIALNAWLRGLDRAAFEAEQRDAMENGFSKMSIMGFGGGFGPWTRDPALRENLIARRLACYDAVSADWPTALRRYEVEYVALTAGTQPDYLGDGWQRLQRGAYWDVWQYDRARSASTSR